MRATGYVRKLDALGRICLPKKILKELDLKCLDPIDISIDEDSIIFQKYVPSCVFCMSKEKTVEYRGKIICEECMEELKK